MINKLFDLLDDWRHLPAYQLERRADFFFAIHLETILKKLYGLTTDLIIPEFPVRIGEIPEKRSNLNRSFKIDWLLKKSNWRSTPNGIWQDWFTAFLHW